MHSRHGLAILFLALFGACMTPSSAGVCKSIHIGTDTKSSTINDIVADGETSKLWKEDSYSPVIVTHSKKIDYFYMINLEVDVTNENVHIKYDNSQYANTSVNVKEEAGKKHWYTLEVVYNCEAYGGALLTYTMEVDIPDCGSAEFTWKKVCGYPQTPRDGFTIDMTYGDDKINIVKNGLPVSKAFWDKDVGDWAIVIPPNVNSAQFDVYMNKDDIKTKASDTDSWLSDSTVGTVPETTVSSPKIDSDDAVADVEMTGALVGKGGVVKEEKTKLNIEFNCQRVKDYSTVEFVIPMTNFRDINLFFYKECDNAGKGLLFWLFVIVIAFLVYKVLVNISSGRKGLDVIPFTFEATVLLGWVWKTGSELCQKLSSSSEPSAQSRSSSKSSSSTKAPRSVRYDEDDEANDFGNVKNISEISDAEAAFDENKYGTI